MDLHRTANLFGALALAVTDQLQATLADTAGHGAAAPAALIQISSYPGQTIDQLRAVLQLSHSGTVRLIDRLAQDLLVERRAGADARAVSLYLTPQGETRAQALLAARQQLLEQTLQQLSDIEREQLTGLLETALTQIVTGRQHADHLCRLCDETVCPAATCPAERAAQPRQFT